MQDLRFKGEKRNEKIKSIRQLPHELLCKLLQNLPLYVKDTPAITGMSNTETQFQWFPLLYSNLVAFVHEQDSRKHRQN